MNIWAKLSLTFLFLFIVKLVNSIQFHSQDALKSLEKSELNLPQAVGTLLPTQHLRLVLMKLTFYVLYKMPLFCHQQHCSG